MKTVPNHNRQPVKITQHRTLIYKQIKKFNNLRNH
jgi:hypothetical protein